MTTGLLTTTLGRAAIIADLGGGADLVLTHVAWGDSHGIPYTPNEAQTTLDNEKYRATIASVAVAAGAIVVDAIIPADTNDGLGRPSHGFNVAEVGLFSSTGVLIGVARCGNGYKPPPSSGQAHDVTYRLQLAVANPSAITVVVDPQAQINVGRHIRPFWLTVDGRRNDPPAAPAIGATYIIGAAPTGAWTGFANRIAQWVGVWTLATAPIGHQALDASALPGSGDRWLERTADGWEPGLTVLLQHQRGNYVVAAGTANNLEITLDPAPPMAAALDGVPIRVLITQTNTAFTDIRINGIMFQMRHENGSIIQPGDLVAGAIETIICSGNGVMQVRDRYVISSPITVTVHGNGADFADLNAAFLWLSGRRITKTGSVTFQLAAGTGASAKIYNGAGNTILFQHPDSDRVIIKGAAMAGAYPALADLAMTGFSSGARTADAASNLTLLRARFGTEIRLTTGAIADFRGGCQVKDILFVGDGSANDGVFFRFGSFSTSRVWAHGFGARGIVAAAGYVGTDNLGVTGCSGTGLSAEATGSFQVQGGALMAFGNGGAGIRALSASSIMCLAGGLVHSRGNAASGVLADEGSSVQVNAGSTANSNGSSGFVALEGSLVKAPSCTATSNGAYGAYASGTSRIVADSLTATPNTTGGIYAVGGSTNTAVGATGTLSPAANTVGNSNSLNVQ